jgi:catechol 2,3-dioxygenase-like lactoylglutathione lyase family enzyme
LSSGEGVPIPSLTLTSHPGEEPDGNPILLDQVGITHFSITVADVNALAEELISKGVEPAGPKESFINAEGKFRYIYVRDPDGILIQFDSGGAG